MIPITTVRFGEAEERRVLEVLRSGSIAQGPVVAELESRFAELQGTRHAVAVNNGTTALIAALQVLDLEPGDEVITSPFTFVATLNAILQAGATARFADIRDDDFNVDPQSMTGLVSDRTKVLLPVHLYGQMADMAPIAELAADRGLSIVEDAAQSHGADYRSTRAGGFGLGTFSFYATKNITTAEGGMITTNDDDLAARLRILRNQGMRARYEYLIAGNNYRLTDLQAALAIPQLERYEQTVNIRRANAAFLSEALSDVDGVVVPTSLPGRGHVWHQYTIRVTAEAAVSRDEFVTALTDRGIGCGVYYPKLLGDYDAYRDRADVILDETPVARRVATEVVSLPVHTDLSRSELETIADAVREVAAGR
ncbi:DegT/DnrJ/EryC1/StrS family aminotransferase [Plantibacter sp. YIM 135249]|uniref:DegT/DnrJ/EryC1/StrS family aminotransferase n=1 Tax=Plantibacter sp. YIM 135249 TaxID=3423918 RepID=UPI003D334BB9